jgi:hypothetical protein
MAAAITTVRVTRETLGELDRLRGVLHTGTADETIQALIKWRRSQLVRESFGMNSGKHRPFSEVDRGEDRP